MIGRRDKGIGGQLFANEVIVGHVLVQSLDHPISVGVGEGITSAFSSREIPFGVGIPGDVQPMSSPPFTEPRGRQKTVDEFGVCLGALVFNESIDFLKGWF